VIVTLFLPARARDHVVAVAGDAVAEDAVAEDAVAGDGHRPDGSPVPGGTVGRGQAGGVTAAPPDGSSARDPARSRSPDPEPR
jgi:hypothetical protein